MKSNTYVTSKAFAGSIGIGHTINFTEPTTIDECKTSGYLPTDEVIVAKAVAQWRISAVHGAARWAELEVKAGRTPTVAQVEAKVQEFRYAAEVRARGTGDGSKTTAKETRTKAKAFDATLTAMVAAAMSGKFGATALDALVGATPGLLDALRDAASAEGATVPSAVEKFLAAQV